MNAKIIYETYITNKVDWINKLIFKVQCSNKYVQ